MPLPAYLQDPDLQNYLGASNDDEEDNPQNVPGQLQPPAVGQLPAPPPPTPEMLKLLNSSTIPKVAPPPPPPSDLDNAQAALTASQANRSALAQQRPALPQPKWWQRLAAGAAGGLAGYENAAGRIRRPIDPTGLEQGILQGNYPRQEQQWQRNVGAADADVQAQQAKLDTIAKIRELNTKDQLQKSEIDKNAAEGTYYSGRNDAATEGKKDADNERWEAALIKGREAEAAYQKEGQPVPAGYEAIPSLVHPGYVIVVPPHVVPLPKDLAPYVPGRAVGDPIPYGEFKKAQAAAQQDLIKNTNKPAKLATSPDEVLLNPGEHTPEQVAQAKSMFAQMHRAPVDPWAGFNSPANAVPPNATPGQRNEAVIGSLNPQMQTLVKGLTDYSIPLPQGRALSDPKSPWVQALTLAKQYDPSFDVTQYGTRKGMREDFTKGKSAQSINALNTVIGHLDSLQQAGDKLHNFGGLATPLNGPVNAVESFFGDPRKNNFELDKIAVADELTKAWRQSGGTEADIKAWGDRISASQSPEALHQAVAEAKKLLASKLSSLKAQYETGMGRPADFHILTPQSAASLKRSGVEADDLAPGQAGSLNPPQQAAQPGQQAPPKQVTDPLPIGEHTFANGQTWRKYPDGSVVFVK